MSNKEDGGPGRPAASGGVGYSCIAEQRTVETILAGKPSTPFLRFGDRVRIEMLDDDGRSIFGAIEQTLRQTLSKAVVGPRPSVRRRSIVRIRGAPAPLITCCAQRRSSPAATLAPEFASFVASLWAPPVPRAKVQADHQGKR